MSRPTDGSGPRPPWRRSAPSSPGSGMLADLMDNHLDAGYAEAARRRGDRTQSPRVRRVRSSLTALCAAAVGLILATAYQQAVTSAPEAARTREALRQTVQRRQTETDDLQRRTDRLRDRVARDQDAALAGSATGRTEARRLREAEATTGLAAVRGPGVVVELADGPRPSDPVSGEPTADEYLGRVQDRDVQDVVNELWRAGAEAIAVDGQRLTATSAIRTAGEAVLVGFRPVSSPYTIAAIGDYERLSDRFTRSGTARRFRAFAKDLGMGFEVRRVESVSLAAGPPVDLRYATRPSASPSAGTTPGGTPSAGPRDATPSAGPRKASPSAGPSPRTSVRSSPPGPVPSDGGGE